MWCRGLRQVSLQEPAWIASVFPALLVHKWASECGWFGLCAMTEMEVSRPAQHHGSPLLSLIFASGSCGFCFSHVTGFNAYTSHGWKTSSGQCVPQRSLNLRLGIVIFKCYYVNQQLCAHALLTEEMPESQGMQHLCHGCATAAVTPGLSGCFRKPMACYPRSQSAMRYDTHLCGGAGPTTIKIDTARGQVDHSNEIQMFSNLCLFFILFSLH